MKVIGLDIGRHSIKVTTINFSFKRYETTLIQSFPYGIAALENEEPEKGSILLPTQLNMLVSLKNSGILDADRIITPLPDNLFSFRKLSLPVKDKKLIRQSIRFELEDEIPISIDDIALDFISRPSATDPKKSDIKTVVTTKNTINMILKDFASIGIDPDTVTVNLSPYETLSQNISLLCNLEKPFIVTNLGHRKSTIMVLQKGEVILSKTCYIGGYDIINAFAKTYNITLEEAEQALIHNGFVITSSHRDVTEDQQHFSTTIKTVLQPLLKDIKQTLFALRSISKDSPCGLFLTGGLSRISNLPLFFEEEFEIQVHHLNYLPALALSNPEIDTKKESLFAESSGLALINNSKKTEFFDFRKNEYAKRSPLSTLSMAELRYPVTFVGILLAITIVSILVQSSILSMKIASQQDELKEAVTSVFGKTKKEYVQNLIKSPSTMKKEINRVVNDVKNKVTILERSGESPIDLLLKLSLNIPKSLTLDVSKLQIFPDKVIMSGSIENEKQIDDLVETLKQIPNTDKITKGEIKNGKNGKKLFSLNFVYNGQQAVTK